MKQTILLCALLLISLPAVAETASCVSEGWIPLKGKSVTIYCGNLHGILWATTWQAKDKSFLVAYAPEQTTWRVPLAVGRTQRLVAPDGSLLRFTEVRRIQHQILVRLEGTGKQEFPARGKWGWRLSPPCCAPGPETSKEIFAMPELWHAFLHPDGPNYEHWHKVLGMTRVPLTSSKPIKAELGPEKDVEVYLLDLKAMTLRQRSNLLGFFAQKFGVPVYEVEAQFQKDGCPIRAADVIVSHDMRAFV